MEIISNSEQETIELGKSFARNIKVGDIIILTGDLGSGKTKFTEGVLTYLGLKDEISSPTFTIVNEYNVPNLNLYHFDLYRLEDIDEFEAIGGEEYFEKGASIIEWGEMIEEIIQNDYIKIEFTRNLEDENKRNINITKVYKK